MKLGILVNTDKHLDDVIGLTRSAVAKGHEVILFTMDDGIRLFDSPQYAELCSLNGVRMSFCDHNAQQLQLQKESLSDAIVCGSQYDNAVMYHEADTVLVL